MLFDAPPAANTLATVDYWAVASEGFTIAVVWFLALLVTAYRKNSDEFGFIVWIQHNITRFVVGGILTVGIVTLNALSQNISELFRILGFTTEKTAISFGMAIAMFLIGGLSAAKPTVKSPEGG